WSQAVVTDSPQARSLHGMAYDASRGATVLFGGVHGTTMLGDTWEIGFGFPIIDQQPTNSTPCAHGVAQFSVAAHAEGNPTVTYQWRRGGVTLVDGGHISGATTATLTLSPVMRGDRGLYDVVVTDACGSIVSNASRFSGICLESGPQVPY